MLYQRLNFSRECSMGYWANSLVVLPNQPQQLPQLPNLIRHRQLLRSGRARRVEPTGIQPIIHPAESERILLSLFQVLTLVKKVTGSTTLSDVNLSRKLALSAVSPFIKSSKSVSRLTRYSAPTSTARLMYFSSLGSRS